MESESFVLVVHGVLAEMGEATRGDRLILIRSSFGAVLGGEFRQRGACQGQTVVAVGGENQQATWIESESRRPLAGSVNGVGRNSPLTSSKRVGEVKCVFVMLDTSMGKRLSSKELKGAGHKSGVVLEYAAMPRIWIDDQGAVRKPTSQVVCVLRGNHAVIITIDHEYGLLNQ